MANENGMTAQAQGLSPAAASRSREVSWIIEDLNAIVEFGDDFKNARGAGAAMYSMVKDILKKLDEPRGLSAAEEASSEGVDPTPPRTR